MKTLVGGLFVIESLPTLSVSLLFVQLPRVRDCKRVFLLLYVLSGS